MTDELEAAKVRLEGSFEVLEDARLRYARLSRLLSNDDWAAEPIPVAEQLRSAASHESEVAEHLENVDQFLSRNAVPGVVLLRSQVQKARAVLTERIRRALTEEKPRLLADAFQTLVERIAVERDLPQSAIESPIILSGRLSYRTLLIAALMVMPYVAMGVGAWVELAWLAPVWFALGAAPAVWTALRGGRYELTTSVLTIRRRGRKPIRLRVAGLREGAVKCRGKKLRIASAPHVVAASVEHAPTLVAALEVLRILHGHRDRQIDPIRDCAVLSRCTMTGAVEAKGVLVIRPEYAAFIRDADAGRFLREVLGGECSVEPSLDAILMLFRHVSEAAYDEAVRDFAGRHGLVISRKGAVVRLTPKAAAGDAVVELLLSARGFVAKTQVPENREAAVKRLLAFNGPWGATRA